MSSIDLLLTDDPQTAVDKINSIDRSYISRGSTNTPVYFDADGNAQPITSYSGQAQKALMDSNGNVITSYYLSADDVKGVGSATQPVYFDNNGIAMPTSYKLAHDVPADAKLTDTTYSAGDNITLDESTNAFSLTKDNVVGALGYTPKNPGEQTYSDWTQIGTASGDGSTTWSMSNKWETGKSGNTGYFIVGEDGVLFVDLTGYDSNHNNYAIKILTPTGTTFTMYFPSRAGSSTYQSTSGFPLANIPPFPVFKDDKILFYTGNGASCTAYFRSL